MRYSLIGLIFLLIGGSIGLEGAAGVHLMPEVLVEADDFAEEAAAKEVLADLSLDEKIGQLIIAGMPGTEVTEDLADLIEERAVGGFILFAHNLETMEQAAELTNDLKARNKDNALPLWMSIDQEGGRVTRLPELPEIPSNKQIAEQEGMAESFGKLLGEQVAAVGFNMNYAPVLDVNNEPTNPVIGDRSFGDEPEIVSMNGIAMIEGMQQTNVVPVVKHFPGHGDVTVDSHHELPVIDKSLAELSEVELQPFEAAITHGVELVMVGHLLLPQLDAVYPASLSEEIVTNLLRDSLGFDGVVITDDMTMGAIANEWSLDEAAVQMLKAGVDLLLLADQPAVIEEVIEGIKRAVKEGELTEERIDESVLRIIQLKETYELDDQPVQPPNVSEMKKAIAELETMLGK